MPETVLVAISGFGSSPLAVRLDPKIFNGNEEFKVTSWENITGLVNAAKPETVLVAISGFGSSPFAVRLDPKIFDSHEEFKVPSCSNITGLVNAANAATTTTNARNIKLKFRHIIALPPFFGQNSYRFHIEDSRRVDCQVHRHHQSI